MQVHDTRLQMQDSNTQLQMPAQPRRSEQNVAYRQENSPINGQPSTSRISDRRQQTPHAHNSFNRRLNS